MSVGTGICVLACESGKSFANKILVYLNEYLKENGFEDSITLTPTLEQRFANTEIKSNILESVRGKDVYIVQDVANKENSTYSVNDNLMALNTLILSARWSDAKRICVILPVFPYARQDKPWEREGITSKLVAKQLESAGADVIITLDLHNPSIVGFFDRCIVENLNAFRNIYKYVKNNLDLSNLVVTAPDFGGIKRATWFASTLNLDMVTIYKERNYKKINSVSKMELIGDINGKDVFLVDDILDTAGSLMNAINLLKEKGANKIYFACSLPLFNGPAIERVNELYNQRKIEKIIGTDVVNLGPNFEKENPWYVSVVLADYFAKLFLICIPRDQ